MPGTMRGMKYLLMAVMALLGSVFAAVPKPPSQICVDDQCSALPPPPTGNLMVSDGFEGGSIDLYKWTLSNNGNAVHSIVSSPVRAGIRAHKCVLTWSSISDFRCELSSGSAQDAYRTQGYFTDSWWGFSTYLPSNNDKSKTRIIAQWHGMGGFVGTPDANDTVGYPPLNLRASVDGAEKIQCSTSPHQPTLETERVPCFPTVTLGPIAYDRYVDWVFRIRWDYRSQPTGDGLLQVWRNGVLVVDKSHLSIGYNDSKLHFFKFGEYIADLKRTPYPPAGSQYIIYDDEFKLAGPTGNYSLVAPGQ